MVVGMLDRLRRLLVSLTCFLEGSCLVFELVFYQQLAVFVDQTLGRGLYGVNSAAVMVNSLAFCKGLHLSALGV